MRLLLSLIDSNREVGMRPPKRLYAAYLPALHTHNLRRECFYPRERLTLEPSETLLNCRMCKSL